MRRSAQNKYVNPETLSAVVSNLLVHLSSSDFVDADEYRLSKELAALPLHCGWWDYIFLRPDGEVISVDMDSTEVERSCEIHKLLRALAVGAKRYPVLATLIPERPTEAEDCLLCKGSGTRLAIGGNEMLCPLCSGLRWTLLSDSSSHPPVP
jgi:hypothetical protein